MHVKLQNINGLENKLDNNFYQFCTTVDVQQLFTNDEKSFQMFRIALYTHQVHIAFWFSLHLKFSRKQGSNSHIYGCTQKFNIFCIPVYTLFIKGVPALFPEAPLISTAVKTLVSCSKRFAVYHEYFWRHCNTSSNITWLIN